MFKTKINQKSKNISAGELHVTNQNEVISTVLGSCVSVCLFDQINNVSGINHFMLPEKITSSFVNEDNQFDGSLLLTNSLRYGAYSMELLINEILKLGGEKKYLNAKVFGGGNVLNIYSDKRTIGEQNIDFVLAFLKAEKIDVISKDVGGNTGRKLLYYTKENKVYIKNIPIRSIPEERNIRAESGDIFLFK